MAVRSSLPCTITGCMPKICRCMEPAPVHAGPGGRDLLDQQRGLGDADAVSAVLLRGGDAEPAAVGERPVEVGGELVRRVPLRPILVVEACGRLAHRRADGLSALVELEVHDLTSLPR